MSVARLKARVEKVREVQRSIMVESKHYGKVPGTKDKDCLFKPGAELLGMAFQLGPDFKAEERWDGEHLECVVTCTLFQTTSGAKMGSAIGSCSTKEKKYAWRNSGKKCPNCGKDGPLTKSKDKPEWFCWRRKDGCGATFPAKDERITSQVDGRVQNPDLADNYNTVRKMACKRAHVAAILFVTCASEIFTQDIEDSDEVVVPVDPMTDARSMHTMPGDEADEPAKESKEFDELMGTMRGADKALFDPGVSWETLLNWRHILGKKDDSANPFRKRLSELYQGDSISAGQRKDMSALAARLYRKLHSLESKMKGPDVLETMTQGDDTEVFSPTAGSEEA